MGRAKLRSWCSGASTFKPPFWAGVQTTNSPYSRPYSSWELFRVTQDRWGWGGTACAIVRTKATMPPRALVRLLVHGHMSRLCFADNSKIETTNSKTTFCSPPLESNIPGQSWVLRQHLLVPLSRDIRLIGSSKWPLKMTTIWCTGPAIDLWPGQSLYLYGTAYSGGVWWKAKASQVPFPFFSPAYFLSTCVLSLDIRDTNSALRSCMFAFAVYIVSVYLICKCTHCWEAKHNNSHKHLSDRFSFAEQQRADGFSQLYSQLQNYGHCDEIASCFFGVLNREPLKSLCRR